MEFLELLCMDNGFSVTGINFNIICIAYAPLYKNGINRGDMFPERRPKTRECINTSKYTALLSHILMHLNSSTVMPGSQHSATLTTVMVVVFQRGHQVWDTSQTETATNNGSPSTVPR
ncbi:unnamed protein product [Aspergillus oryzae]|uniref:Unnamed protein product n=1 Tax=Aspergillus oryzae TaxID=5062 RepID=A0AAN4YL34_ASPOZ|nr:unnamed protein product [Aspergillus oryzae]